MGIDLGSTTTKAVILDEHGLQLGRGITNSRSNYDVACSVARSEANANVRLTLCARELSRSSLSGTQQAEFLAALERAFQRSQHTEQLAALRQEMEYEAPQVERYYPGKQILPTVKNVLAAMEREQAGLFQKDSKRHSDFFRDIASSQYHRLAKGFACPEQRPFEALTAVFDKAILKVENREFQLSYEAGAGWAIDLALDEVGIRSHSMAHPVQSALKRAFAVELEEQYVVGTGYGRARLPFEKQQIRSEILCHGLGAHHMFPETRTVLDIGGQDTKAIQVDGNGIVTSFQMNDRCAAGCGRYLGYIADEMSLGLHELGPLAGQSKAPVKINSTCTVFAGAELRDRLTLGQRREDILAGLHRAVMLRAMSLLARSGGIDNEFTFTGGVARNVTAVSVLQDLVQRNYGDRTLNISPECIYTGALGAALFACQSADNLEPVGATS
jgi:benzoyl-CoA reductase subunit A